LVGRVFITGVTPITMDSMTSGFNIVSNLTNEEELNGFMGFTEVEVMNLLRAVGGKEEELSGIISDLKVWYDGYLFNIREKEHIYNSDMVLYFAKEYQINKAYPDNMLDENIASDYTKVGNLFKIGGNETQNHEILEELLEKGSVTASLVGRFSFEKGFNKNDFISLLFYMGVLTMERAILNRIVFKMPNYVIANLYYQYFNDLLLRKSNLEMMRTNVFDDIDALAFDNDLRPLSATIQRILQELSVRDAREFSEKHLKVIVTSLFHVSGVYLIQNEFEVKKGLSNKGFIDILLLKREPFDVPHQFLFELKYVKKQNAVFWEEQLLEAENQIKAYLQDDFIRQISNLCCYAVVVVGSEVKFKAIL
jgi:hypothetical protein